MLKNYGAHFIKQHIMLSFSIPTKEPTCQFLKKNTHNYVFSHTKTCYLKHNIKHIFYLINTVNTYFYNIF